MLTTLQESADSWVRADKVLDSPYSSEQTKFFALQILGDMIKLSNGQARNSPPITPISELVICFLCVLLPALLLFHLTLVPAFVCLCFFSGPRGANGDVGSSSDRYRWKTLPRETNKLIQDYVVAKVRRSKSKGSQGRRRKACATIQSSGLEWIRPSNFVKSSARS